MKTRSNKVSNRVFPLRLRVFAGNDFPQSRKVLGGVIQDRHPGCLVLFPDGLARDENR